MINVLHCYIVILVLVGGLTGRALVYGLKTGQWFWFAIGVAVSILSIRLMVEEAIRNQER